MLKRVDSKSRSRVLSDHRRHKKVLVAPLTDTASWAQSLERDGILALPKWVDTYLPELLWLANLALTGDVRDIAPRFNRACDLLDRYVRKTAKSPFVGYISDFGLIDARKRKTALATLLNSAPDYLGFDRNFRCLLSMYNSPASWLAAGVTDVSNRLEIGERRLRSLISLLKKLDSEELQRARIVGLNRLFLHDKLFFDSSQIDPAVVDALSKYPDCDAEDQAKVVQLCRIISNLDFTWREYETWNRTFWSSNSLTWSCNA